MEKAPLLRDQTRLRAVHRQRVTRYGDADPAPLIEAARLAPDVLANAAVGWQRLLETEYESIVISSWMTSALARLGAPLDLVGAFGRIVEDEIRHVDLCAQLVDGLHGKPLVPHGAMPPFPTHATTERQAEVEVVSGLVGFFCVFEHLSALVFARAIDAAEEPLAKWALSEIYRDEGFHGAFGFEAAKHYVPKWTEAERTQLADRVAVDIRRFEERLLAGRVAPALSAKLEPLGLLGAEALLSVFYGGVERELIPRLQELGVPISVQPSATPA